MGWNSAKPKTTISHSLPLSPTFIKPKIDFSKLVTLDFETYYSADFTLSELSTSEYIRDPRFKAHMVGIKIGNRKTKVVPTKNIGAVLRMVDWKTHDLLCHNTAFDGFILSHHFGVVPRTYYDTLSMARGLHSNDIGASLDEVAQYYDVGNKIDNVLEHSKDIVTLSKPLYTSMAEYCAMDVELTLLIFKKMLDQYPNNELKLIDVTIRMFCDPILRVDIPRVEKELARELKYREDLMMNIVDVTQYPEKELLKNKIERELTGVARHMLMVKRIIGSNEKFANLLRAEQIEPPTKISPAWIKKPVDERKDEDKYSYAFAKDDQGFIELPDKIEELGADLNLNSKKDIAKLTMRQERVRNLVDCRIAVKSTTNITRSERFLTAGAGGLPLPVGYAYYRAHCLTGDAQVLTRDGWVRLDKWTGGEIVQWQPDGSNALDFGEATANVFEVNEPLVVANSRYHHSRYTLGHTLPTYNSFGEFKARQAGTVFDSRFELPISGMLLGDIDISELDVQLAAMMQADGNKLINRKDIVFVLDSAFEQRKIDRCIELLTQANIPHKVSIDFESSTRIIVDARNMHMLLKLIDPETKQFRTELLSAPIKSRLSFLKELIFWDGFEESHKQGFTYYTNNLHNAEMVQTLAHISERSAFISKRVHRADWNDSFRVYIRKDLKTRSEPKHYTLEQFSGSVYCPTTKTGYFLMKQGERIVITGNTGRWGGNNKMNMQNLTRGGELRQSILAPKGHMLVVGDSGQIECRVNGWLWEQDDLLAAFRDADAGVGRDAYCRFGDIVYGREINKEEDKVERFVGKVCVLGLGFQMGAPKFQITLAKGALGGPPVFFELDRCKTIVNAYRRQNFKIAAGWKRCEQIIEDMAAGRTGTYKCISWEKERIWLPNGMCLKYPDLKKKIGEKGWDEWTYQSKTIRKKIYGGLLCENLVQALARIIVAEQLLMVHPKRRIVMITHDEGVLAVRKASAALAYRELIQAMRTPLSWCMDLPLNSEGGFAENYSK